MYIWPEHSQLIIKFSLFLAGLCSLLAVMFMPLMSYSDIISDLVVLYEMIEYKKDEFPRLIPFYATYLLVFVIISSIFRFLQNYGNFQKHYFLSV